MTTFNDLTEREQSVVTGLLGQPYQDSAGVTYTLPTDKEEFVKQLTAPRYAPSSNLPFGTIYLPVDIDSRVSNFFQSLDIYEAKARRIGQGSIYETEPFKTLYEMGTKYTAPERQETIFQAGERWWAGRDYELDQLERNQLNMLISRIGFALVSLGAGWWASAGTTAAQQGTTEATTTAAGAGSAPTVTGPSIDLNYFGFEPDTIQSLGLSEYAGGAQALSPEAASSLGISPALTPIETKISTTFKRTFDSMFSGKAINDAVAFVKGLVGRVGDGLVDLFTGNIDGAIRNFTGQTPRTITNPLGGSSRPIVVSGGGGGGSLYNPNTAVGETGNGAAIFFAALAGVVIVALLLKKKG